MIGANAADGPQNSDLSAGEVYVLFGSRELPSTIDLFSPRWIGINLYGGNSSGAAVSGAGDVNGDGFDDLLIGTDTASRAYVVYGDDFSMSVTHAGQSRPTF